LSDGYLGPYLGVAGAGNVELDAAAVTTRCQLLRRRTGGGWWRRRWFPISRVLELSLIRRLHFPHCHLLPPNLRDPNHRSAVARPLQANVRMKIPRLFTCIHQARRNTPAFFFPFSVCVIKEVPTTGRAKVPHYLRGGGICSECTEIYGWCWYRRMYGAQRAVSAPANAAVTEVCR